jgi:hypothetical protein
MKKATHRKPQITPRQRFAEDDNLVLADLWAVRDDNPPIIAPPATPLRNDQAAFDRLSARTPIVEVLMPTDLTPPATVAGGNRFSALDDFEPDFATAFVVEPLADPHRVEPIAEAPETTVVYEPVFSVDPNTAGFDPFEPVTARLDDGWVDTAFHNEAAIVMAEPIRTPEPPPAFFAGVVDGEAIEIAPRHEPIVAFPEAALAETFTPSPEFVPVEFHADDGPDIKPASVPEEPIAPETVPPVRQAQSDVPPDFCVYKTKPMRKTQWGWLNVLSLIVSVAASLAAVVLYLILQDTRDDVAKLNEMVDIMKDDIQMGRDEARGE